MPSSRKRSRSRSTKSRTNSIPDAQPQEYSFDKFNEVMEEIQKSPMYKVSKKSPPTKSELKYVKQNIDDNVFRELLKNIPEPKLKSPTGDGAQESEYYFPKSLSNKSKSNKRKTKRKKH
jgi:hypothetical protein